MVRAVLYDLGDIFFEAHHWRMWMHRTLRDRGFVTGSFAEFYWSYEDILRPVYEGRRSYEHAYHDFITSLGVPDVEAFVAESFAVKHRFEVTRTLYDGVRETLTDLRASGIANVVVSDNELSADDLRRRVLSRFGLNQLIDAVVTSLDAGVRKPARGIFQRALRLADRDRHEAVFVGHDADEIAGANAFGLCTIEFNNYLQADTGADYCVTRFADLGPMVRKLAQADCVTS